MQDSVPIGKGGMIAVLGIETDQILNLINLVNKEKDGVFYLEDKSDTKLFTLMNEDVENLDKVFYNIMKFRANIDDEMGSVVQQLGKRVS